jgi:hypothetical protein
MRTIKLSFAFLVLLAVAQAQSIDSIKTRVLSLENAWNEAEAHGDTKALEGLLAPEFAYTDAQGEFMSKAEFLASIKESADHPEQIVNENMSVHVYEHAAIVTGAYREKGMANGKPFTHRGRFTDTWVEQNGAWLCAASEETLTGK